MGQGTLAGAVSILLLPRGQEEPGTTPLASRVPHRNSPSSQELWFEPVVSAGGEQWER